MSKNKYYLPMKGIWYIEFGGTKKKNSHSWDIIGQRYAYDFEIDRDRVLEGNVDFLDAVNESVSKSGNTAAVFENIFLGLETRPFKPRVYPKTDFFPLKTLKFEGYDFPVPNKYDKLLNMVYGNYWEFPMHSHNHLDLGSLDLDEIDKLDKYKNF